METPDCPQVCVCVMDGGPVWGVSTGGRSSIPSDPEREITGDEVSSSMDVVNGELKTQPRQASLSISTITGRSWLTWQVVTSMADSSALSQLICPIYTSCHPVFAANFQTKIGRMEKGLFVSHFRHIFHLNHNSSTCPDEVMKMRQESEQSSFYNMNQIFGMKV